jgi:alpha-L-fucosidase 2
MSIIFYSTVSIIIFLLSVTGKANSEDTANRNFLDNYNIVWETPSEDSRGSMPIGNGDIGANVWVEQNGDPLFYLSKTDTWSENCRLLKLGKVRVALTPNPIQEGCAFNQTLNIKRGEIFIRFKNTEQDLVIRLAIDANHPLVTVDIDCNHPVEAKVSLEHWRDKRRELQGIEAHPDLY